MAWALSQVRKYLPGGGGGALVLIFGGGGGVPYQEMFGTIKNRILHEVTCLFVPPWCSFIMCWAEL